MTPQLVRSEQPRLHGQCQRVMSFYLSHPGYWTLQEVARAIGAISEAGLSARLRQVCYAPEDGGFGWERDIRKRAKNLWEYSLKPPKHAPPQLDLL